MLEIPSIDFNLFKNASSGGNPASLHAEKLSAEMDVMTCDVFSGRT
jgi:hypothetical protein